MMAMVIEMLRPGRHILYSPDVVEDNDDSVVNGAGGGPEKNQQEREKGKQSRPARAI